MEIAVKKKTLKKFIIGIILVVIVIGGYYFMAYKNEFGNEAQKVILETTKGNIIIELNEKAAPITVKNFLTYVNDGHYDGTVFHRIIDGFMIQGGGFDEAGNEKETRAPIKLESKNGLDNDRGTIAMARTNDQNSATSQFFINSVDNDFLNYAPGNDGYAVFGKVVEGMDVVDEIGKVETDSNDKPLEEVKILRARVI